MTDKNSNNDEQEEIRYDEGFVTDRWDQVTEKSDIRETIEHAKQHLDRDPSLAVYMLRDHPETEAAELSDLAWALSSPSNYCHKNDAAWFIEMLENYLSKQEAQS